MKWITKKITIIIILLCCLVSGCEGPGKTITVIFGDGKGLSDNANVYLAGVVIGKVASVGLKDGKAAVRIRIDGDKWQGLRAPLAFFIDIDPYDRMRPAILVRGIGGLGGKPPQPLTGNEIFEGIDSPLAWKTIEFAKGVEEFEKSEFFKQLQEQMRPKP
jgi:hypothetical protein